MGLGRGFVKAGARNVLASLWEIPDESTAELMKDFYQRLGTGKDKPSSLLWKMQREAFSRVDDEEKENAILSYGGFGVSSTEVAAVEEK